MAFRAMGITLNNNRVWKVSIVNIRQKHHAKYLKFHPG
jgi:hypothetical protein